MYTGKSAEKEMIKEEMMTCVFHTQMYVGMGVFRAQKMTES